MGDTTKYLHMYTCLISHLTLFYLLKIINYSIMMKYKNVVYISVIIIVVDGNDTN